VTSALVFLLLLQGDPQIEKVERLLGNVHRPLLWMPLRVTVASASDFSGDLVAPSKFGFSVARKVRIKAGGREEILLPSLGAAEVVLGQTRFKLPGNLVNPDRIVLVDARLPYAAELQSTEKILYQRIPPEDLENTLPRGLLEAADLILLREGSGGCVAATREEAEKAVAEAPEHAPCLEVVDRAIWTEAPPPGWVPAKKSWTLFFATTYAFAAFVALAVVAKRFPKFGLFCMGGLAALGILGYRLFPRGQVWIVGQAVNVIPAAGAGQEQRIWFVQSAAEIAAAKLDFPRLVKPIFASIGGTEDPFTIRVDDRGSSVEGLKLLPGRPACFGGIERLSTAKEPEGLNGSVVVRAGEVEGGGPVSDKFKAWKRFVGRDGRFGLAGGGDLPSGRVGSPDHLADEHERPPIFIRLFK
jgi:hypothetical protein